MPILKQSPAGLFCIVAASVLSTVHAEPAAKVLQGKYLLHGKIQTIAPAKDSSDAHLTLYLEGEAAKALFMNMKTSAKSEECLGGKTKRASSGTWCNESPDKKAYECTLSIHINGQKIVPPSGEDC